MEILFSTSLPPVMRCQRVALSFLPACTTESPGSHLVMALCLFSTVSSLLLPYVKKNPFVSWSIHTLHVAYSWQCATELHTNLFLRWFTTKDNQIHIQLPLKVVTSKQTSWHYCHLSSSFLPPRSSISLRDSPQPPYPLQQLAHQAQ